MTSSRYAILIGAFSVAACSAEHAGTDIDHVEAAKAEAHTHTHATVKPGANVVFSSELREALSPGDAGALEITISEGYKAGSMKVTAKPGEGLELFTTIDETTFDLSESDSHTWTVFFDTEQEGKFYINLQARVETPIGRLGRSYAAPVIVGTPEPKSTDTTSQSVRDGERVVVMEAVETIEQ